METNVCVEGKKGEVREGGVGGENGEEGAYGRVEGEVGGDFEEELGG